MLATFLLKPTLMWNICSEMSRLREERNKECDIALDRLRRRRSRR
jgi:hypothetical protein